MRYHSLLPLLVFLVPIPSGQWPDDADDRRRRASPLPKLDSQVWLMPYFSPGVVEELALDIEGSVSAVDRDLGLVILSVGSDDDVEVGFEFTVYRRDTYIAMVVVEKVLDDMCGARVTHLDKDAEVQAGDNVMLRPAENSRVFWRDRVRRQLQCGVRGLVLKGTGDAKWLYLDIATASRVPVGSHAQIFRGREVIASVIIEQMDDDGSFARVVERHLKIRRGDQVRVWPIF